MILIYLIILDLELFYSHESKAKNGFIFVTIIFEDT